MKEFKEELKALLIKHDAHIYLIEDEGFLHLQIFANNMFETIDSGYRDLIISQDNL